MRLALAAVLLLCAGCGSDFCVPAESSFQTFFVTPPTLQRNHDDHKSFATIQGALDAATGGLETTVCVEAGTYYEELTVPPFVRVIGAGMHAVRIRPPQTRRDAPPSTVDRVLLRTEPSAAGAVRVERLDLGGAAVCVDAQGEGLTRLVDVRIAGCALGLRASGGSLSMDRTPVKVNTIQGLLLRDLDRAQLRDVELIGNGAAQHPLLDVEGAEPAAALDSLAAGSSLRAQRVGTLIVEGTRLRAADYSGAAISIRDSDYTITDTTLQLAGLARSGQGPAFAISGGAGTLQRIIVQGQGHGFVLAQRDASDITVADSVWRDDYPLEDPDEPGTRPAIFDLQVGGSIALSHTTIAATGDAVAFGLLEPTELSVRNSIVWGFGPTRVLTGVEPTGDGFSYSLVDDQGISGEELVGATDPLLDPSSLRLPIARDSAARCTGAPVEFTDTDLLGNPRPFRDGKRPDLGPIELQEDCP